MYRKKAIQTLKFFTLNVFAITVFLKNDCVYIILIYTFAL